MNLPNKLTVLRIILIPVFVAFFFIKQIPYNYVFATVIFCIAAFTDFLDGYFARKLGLVTNLGKFLDPIADKVLVATAMIILLTVTEVMWPILGAICVAIILARELMISAFRQIAATQNVIMAADLAGKIKTFIQDIALIVMIVSCQFVGYDFHIYLSWAGMILLIIATILTIYSAINYIVKNINVLKN